MALRQRIMGRIQHLHTMTFPISKIIQIYPACKEPGKHRQFSREKNTFKSQGESLAAGLPDKNFKRGCGERMLPQIRSDGRKRNKEPYVHEELLKDTFKKNKQKC